MKILLMMVLLFSGCSILDYKVTTVTSTPFPNEWHGYYVLDSSATSLSYLRKSFKVTSDYMTLKNYDNASDYTDDDKFTSYQINSIYTNYIDTDKNVTNLVFSISEAYECQEIPSGHFMFTSKNDEYVIVYYSQWEWFYGFLIERYEQATYKKTTP